MSETTSSAQPEKLMKYAEVALYIDGVLLKEANNLAATLRQFEATCNESEFVVTVSYLADELQDYVRGVRELDEWVGEVGIGFARADVNSLLSILNLLHIPATGRNFYVGTDMLRRILDRYSSSWIFKLGLNLVSLRLILGRGKTLFGLQQERYAQLGLAVVGGWGGRLYAQAMRNPWLFAGPGDGRPHGQGEPPRGGRGRKDKNASKQPPHYYIVNGFYFDYNHIIGGRTDAQRLIKQIQTTIANGGGEITFERQLRHLFTYKATYWISGEIPQGDVQDVSLAIFMDFEFGWEMWQGGILWGKVAHSSFAVEDFPSDYIGFYDATHSEDYMDALSQLGSVMPANDEPPRSSCIGPSCDSFNVKNWDFNGFTPKKRINGEWQNVPWPDSLQMTPIRDRNYWYYVGSQSCLTIFCISIDK